MMLLSSDLFRSASISPHPVLHAYTILSKRNLQPETDIVASRIDDHNTLQ